MTVGGAMTTDGVTTTGGVAMTTVGAEIEKKRDC